MLTTYSGNAERNPRVVWDISALCVLHCGPTDGLRPPQATAKCSNAGRSPFWAIVGTPFARVKLAVVDMPRFVHGSYGD